MDEPVLEPTSPNSWRRAIFFRKKVPNNWNPWQYQETQCDKEQLNNTQHMFWTSEKPSTFGALKAAFHQFPPSLASVTAVKRGWKGDCFHWVDFRGELHPQRPSLRSKVRPSSWCCVIAHEDVAILFAWCVYMDIIHIAMYKYIYILQLYVHICTYPCEMYVCVCL